MQRLVLMAIITCDVFLELVILSLIIGLSLMAGMAPERQVFIFFAFVFWPIFGLLGYFKARKSFEILNNDPKKVARSTYWKTASILLVFTGACLIFPAYLQIAWRIVLNSLEISSPNFGLLIVVTGAFVSSISVFSVVLTRSQVIRVGKAF